MVLAPSLDLTADELRPAYGLSMRAAGALLFVNDPSIDPAGHPTLRSCWLSGHALSEAVVVVEDAASIAIT
jgi:hypothetical protein